MNIEQIAKSVALASALFASTGALAATDGTIGGTSEGTLNVSLTVNDRVLITGLDDIPLGAFDGTADLVGGSTFCVYRNGMGLYDLTVSSQNSSGTDFRAISGTNFIAYSVLVDDSAIAGDGVAVTSGTAQTDLAGHGSSTTCGGTDNASLQVTFTQGDLEAAASGTFTDVITLLVQPS